MLLQAAQSLCAWCWKHPEAVSNRRRTLEAVFQWWGWYRLSATGISIEKESEVGSWLWSIFASSIRAGTSSSATSQRRKIMEGVEAIHTKSLKKQRLQLGLLCHRFYFTMHSCAFELPNRSRMNNFELLATLIAFLWIFGAAYLTSYHMPHGFCTNYCRSTLELWMAEELWLISQGKQKLGVALQTRWDEVLFHQGPVHTEEIAIDSPQS